MSRSHFTDASLETPMPRKQVQGAEVLEDMKSGEMDNRKYPSQEEQERFEIREEHSKNSREVE